MGIEVAVSPQTLFCHSSGSHSKLLGTVFFIIISCQDRLWHHKLPIRIIPRSRGRVKAEKEKSSLQMNWRQLKMVRGNPIRCSDIMKRIAECMQAEQLGWYSIQLYFTAGFTMPLFLKTLRIINASWRSSSFKALTSITSSAILIAYILLLLE